MRGKFSAFRTFASLPRMRLMTMNLRKLKLHNRPTCILNGVALSRAEPKETVYRIERNLSVGKLAWGLAWGSERRRGQEMEERRQE